MGLVHIYCGDGKGKTTSAVGLTVRASGAGMKVLFYQFMKDNKTSERNILNNIENISIIDGLDNEKFSFQMNEEEKKERKEFYTNQFYQITRKAQNEKFDMLVMDEIIYTIEADLLDEKVLVEYLEKKPESLEIVMTGNAPSDTLIRYADYVSEIKKIKHPYDEGKKARIGIEK